MWVQWLRGSPTPLNTTWENTLVIEAAQHDQQAWEDRGVGHGLLTTGLLELFDRGLATPVLFQQVQTWVREKVVRDGPGQVPAKVDTTDEPRFVPFGKR